MSSLRIGIIGAGASGITATKACLEQGFDVVVYEKTDSTTGLWKYREEDVDGIASIMKSTIVNTSKEMSAFSDFPPPKEFPNYMHNTKWAEYLNLYGDSFGFKNYVNFNHEILHCEPNVDYEETGKWKLTIRELKSGQIIHEIFDGVVVGVGHNAKPFIPTFKDQHKFKGSIIHCHSYKKPNNFADKTVIVVGIGNTGGDVVVELSTVAKRVYLSTRSGTWVSRRVGMNGKPLDTQFLRRSWNTMFQLTPYPILCYFAELFINSRFDHKRYQLKPKHRVFSQHIMVNDDLPNRILAGTVVVKGDIDRFTENGIIFEGETEETVCDAVLLATGYQLWYPFLPKSLLNINKSNCNLYKYMFSPNLSHPKTLAILSLIQPVGAVLPISEMQSRWFALLMANQRKLPTREDMINDINSVKRWVQRRFYDYERHAFQVDWIPFMDELAKKVGVKPNLCKYFFTDPKLWNALYFGPCVSYQFRLKGPNPCSRARETILTVKERINAPLNTRAVVKKSKGVKKLKAIIDNNNDCENQFSEIDLRDKTDNEKLNSSNGYIFSNDGQKTHINK